MTELEYGRRIYLARHGETDDNRKKLYSGRHNNTFLTRTGIAKAVDLQPLLEKLDPPPTHVTSSSLERAEQTEHLATHNMTIPHIPSSPHFDERDYEINGRIHDTESEEIHKERVVRGINELLTDPNCIPLVFCHGGTTRRVIDAIANIQNSDDYIHIPNASVIEIVTPSKSAAQDWQINVVSLVENKIERKPIANASNAEKYRRKPDEPKRYHA